MPRKARAIYRGEHYHIISRGNNRQVLFREKEDFEFYLSTLQRYQGKFAIALLHYCLMSNHVHMLMRSEAENNGITKAMHGLQMVYAQKWGRVHEIKYIEQ